MKEQIKAYKEALLKLERQQESAKFLEIGCEVFLRNGTKQTITKIEWGVAHGESDFYRWDSFFPYNIEHAAMYAMYNLDLEIVDVKW